MAKWKNIGPVPYAGNAPGAEFYADIEPAAAERAIARGFLQLISGEEPKLEPSSVMAPAKKKGGKAAPRPEPEPSAEAAESVPPLDDSEVEA